MLFLLLVPAQATDVRCLSVFLVQAPCHVPETILSLREHTSFLWNPTWDDPLATTGLELRGLESESGLARSLSPSPSPSTAPNSVDLLPTSHFPQVSGGKDEVQDLEFMCTVGVVWAEWEEGPRRTSRTQEQDRKR